MAFLIVAAAHAYSEGSASATPITYQYNGVVTEVFLNENNAIPNLAVGDQFTGYMIFESTGWHHTAGTVFALLNGVDLLFTGNYIYGQVNVQPATEYSIRIAGDTGGSIVGSTFSAGNFGPELIDADGSAGITVPFPNSVNLGEFETNSFLISGTLLASNQRLSLRGALTEFTRVPEPCAVTLVLLGIGCVSLRRRAKLNQR